MSNTHSIYADNTPVRAHATMGILDMDKAPLDNFHTITQFIKKMDNSNRVEMLLTLAAFCRQELQG